MKTTDEEKLYGARIDAVVYGCAATADYTREDWLRLALAALDQAGCHNVPADTAVRAELEVEVGL